MKRTLTIFAISWVFGGAASADDDGVLFMADGIHAKRWLG